MERNNSFYCIETRKSKFEIIVRYSILTLAMLVYSSSIFILKIASGMMKDNVQFWIMITLCLSLLGVYSILWQIILKKMPLSIAYASKGMVIIFASLLGRMFLNESISYNDYIGIAIIIMGLWMVNKE